MRDTQLDVYRGLAMVYIVCFIHVLYWQAMPMPYKCYFLVEMPVIFFIAGASFRLSAPKGDKALVVSRFKRVFWPYYKYALLSVVLFGLYYYAGDFSPWLHYVSLKQILLGVGIPEVPYVRHTWFILPYFLLSACSNRLFAWVNTPRRAIVYCVAAVVLIGALDGVEAHMGGAYQSGFYTTLKHVLCYSLFYVAGYCWYKRLSVALLLKLAVAFLLCYAVSRCFYSHDLQANKFPPNLNFILYNAFTLSVLSIICTYVKLSPPHWLQLWQNHGYTIYLYQNVFHIALGVCLVALTGVVDVPGVVRYPLMMVFLLGCGTALGWLCQRQWLNRLLS